MNYMRYNIIRLRESINCDNLNNRCRKHEKDFTRNRKITPKDLILYTLNNRGKTNKMELYDFIQDCNLDEISAPGMLKQREKLNEEIFKELTKGSLERFYGEFPQEVKTYKGYIISAIDGSDCEVPNTKETRERYKSIHSTKENRVARIKLSNCYDVMNGCVLDTEIAEYKHWELELAIKHMENVNYISQYFPLIYVMDRGYFSLAVIYHLIKEKKNFVIRLNKNFLKQETRNLKRMGVEVYFTEDNIWTFNDEDGELKLTLMATLAQNESKKLSQRIKAGQTITFQNGVFYGNGNILGYDRVGKNAVINEEQAEIVRYICPEFLNGKGTTEIATNLEKQGAVTSTGLERWSAAYIARVLRNPFYSGTVIYRKQYIPDYLEQKHKTNYGEVEKIIAEGKHEPIISKEDFKKVQEIMDSHTRQIQLGRRRGIGIAKNI